MSRILKILPERRWTILMMMMNDVTCTFTSALNGPSDKCCSGQPVQFISKRYGLLTYLTSKIPTHKSLNPR